MTTKKIDAAALSLGSTELNVRKAALATLTDAALRGRAFTKPTKDAILACLADPEPDMREAAALTLLRQVSDPTVSESIPLFEAALADPSRRAASLEALVAAAQSYRAIKGALPHLAPFWIAALGTSSEPALPLAGLLRAAAVGADLRAASDRLCALLASASDPTKAQALDIVASALASNALDRAPFIAPATTLASSPSLMLSYPATQLLAADAVRQGDLVRLDQLCSSADDGTREAAIEGIGAAASPASTLHLLLRALADRASGVRYRALNALWVAVANNADLGAGAATIDQAIGHFKLDDQGWAFGVLPTTGETTASNLGSDLELSRILARHYSNTGDAAGLARMLAAGGTRAYCAGQIQSP